jgi:flagellar protein FlbD
MIKITRINGATLFVNAELIEHIESTPDTVITLLNGKTYMVKERIETLIKRILRYKKAINNQIRIKKITKENHI